MNNLDAYALLGRSIGERIRGKSAEEVQNDLEIKKQAALQQAVERAAMDRLMKEIDARATNQREALEAERKLAVDKQTNDENKNWWDNYYANQRLQTELAARQAANIDDNINRDIRDQTLYELSQRALKEGPGNIAEGQAAAAKIPGSQAEYDAKERAAEASLLEDKTRLKKQNFDTLLSPKNRWIFDAHTLNFKVPEDTTLYTPSANFVGGGQTVDAKGLRTWRAPQAFPILDDEEVRKLAVQKALDEKYNKAAADVNAKKKKVVEQQPGSLVPVAYQHLFK